MLSTAQLLLFPMDLARKLVDTESLITKRLMGFQPKYYAKPEKKTMLV